MRILLSSALMTVGLLGLASPAAAAPSDNAMKVCGAKYQAAKAAKTLPAGETWNQFLAQCRKGVAPAAPAPAMAAAHSPAAQSSAMTAMHDRQRRCGQQWKADKAAGKIPAGQTWPQYWSACSKRLKG